MKGTFINRKLFQNIAVYLGTAWVIVEATNFFMQRYSLPSFLDDLVLTVMSFGLVSFVLHSWYETRTGNSGISRAEALFHGFIILMACSSCYLVIRNSGPSVSSYKFNQSESDKSIAVLPFRNLTQNASFDYLGDGIADDIITRLSQSGDFTVISPISSFKHREQDIDLKKISGELGAADILQGNYLIQNNSVRINVKLVNAVNNAIIVARNFDGTIDNILKLQGDVATGIAEALNIRRAPDNPSQPGTDKTVDINVYKNYQKGRSLLREDYISHDVINLSRQFFKKAIEQDSMYANAYVGLAESYYYEMIFGYTSFKTIAPEVKLYATLAKNIQPESGEPYGILGVVALYEYNWEEAKSFLDKSLTLNPNYPFSNYYLSYYYNIYGEKQKAYDQLNRCIVLDPLNSNYQILKAITQFYFKDYKESIGVVNKILATNPGHDEALFTLGIDKAALGDFQGAVDAFSKRAYGTNTNFALGYTYWMMGNTAKARAILDYLLKKANEQYVPATQIALVYMGLHDYSKALDYLYKAYSENDGWLLLWTKYNKFFEPIRTDPRYRELLRKTNLQQD